MRLIDKNKLIDAVTERHYSNASMRLIREQPEVEAIPIEWIREHYSWLTMANEIIEAWEKQK